MGSKIVPGLHLKNIAKTDKHIAQFFQSPFSFIEDLQKKYGNLINLTENQSVLSSMNPCGGSIFALGAHFNQIVFTESHRFQVIPTASRSDITNPLLEKLSTSIFSMKGNEHAACRRTLLPLFNKKIIHNYTLDIVACCEMLLDSWKDREYIELHSEMRKLGLYLANKIIFGFDDWHAIEGPGQLCQKMFKARLGTIMAKSESEEKSAFDELNKCALVFDNTIRNLIKEKRKNASKYSGILGDMCLLKDEHNQYLFSEDALTGHANVLFMAGHETTAAVLTWLFFCLSQSPNDYSNLLDELMGHFTALSFVSKLDTFSLLDHTIKETVRLLPPSSVMLRTNPVETELDGYFLAKNCEIILSPFILHRDETVFARPSQFFPLRWESTHPKPSQYMPFGLGEKYCLGSQLALLQMKTFVGMLCQKYRLELVPDQDVNWQMTVNLMPRGDIRMKLCPTTGNDLPKSQGARGSIYQLITFNRNI